MRSSDSANIILLEKSLSRFKEMQSEGNLYQLQEILEKESRNLALMEKEDSIDALPDYLQKFTGSSRQLITDWYAALLPFIKSELRNPSIDQKYQPYLKLLKPEKLALITIMCFLHVPNSVEIKSGEVMGRQRFTSLSANIGNAIETEINAQVLIKHAERHKPKRSSLYDLHVKGKLTDPRIRSSMMSIARRDLEKNDKWVPKWAPSVTLTVGSTLISMLVMCAKIKIKSPDSGIDMYLFNLHRLI